MEYLLEFPEQALLYAQLRVVWNLLLVIGILFVIGSGLGLFVCSLEPKKRKVKSKLIKFLIAGFIFICLSSAVQVIAIHLTPDVSQIIEFL